MKKTLIISELHPLPESLGSNIRTMHFVRFFETFSNVHIAYMRKLPHNDVNPPRFSTEIPLRGEGDIFSLKGVPSKLFNTRKTPWPVVRLSKQSESELHAAIAREKYDHILVRYVRNAGALFRLPQEYKRRVMIDFDDLYTESLYRTYLDYTNKGPLERAFYRMNWKYLKKYERQCGKFGASILCSEVDSKLFRENTGLRNIFTVPNVYEANNLRCATPVDGCQRGNVLLFVGNLSYKPNLRGLDWFVTAIFPEFRASYSDARLIVVGSLPGDAITRICTGQSGVELVGEVQDLQKYYEECRAVVVPVLSGGGTRIKILEAALASRPVLSTYAGARGLDFSDGRDIMLFRDAGEFMQNYQRLLDRTTYEVLADCARELVSTKYSAHNFNGAMGYVMKEYMGSEISS